MSPSEILQLLSFAQADVERNAKHAYRIRYGDRFEWVPGVTNILKNLDKGDALIGWAAKVQQEADLKAVSSLLIRWMDRGLVISDVKDALKECSHAWKQEREKAASLGTEVHSLIEQFCKKSLGMDVPAVGPVSPKANALYSKWFDWANETHFEPLTVESAVFSRKHRYAGTVDLLALVNDKLTVLDWKCSKAVYAQGRLQNIAYRKACEEMGLPLPEGLLIRIPTDGSDIEPIPVPYSDDAWVIFRALIAIDARIEAVS